MTFSLSHSEQAPMHPALIFQRRSLAACILLAPLSITLYLVSWEGNQRAPLTPLITSAMAGPTGNLLHFIGAIAASFFLPLGYLGMSLLGMRRAPWLATISAAISLILVHTLIFQDVLKYLVCALWIVGAIPAAFAMFTNKDLAQLAPSPAQSVKE